MTRPIFDRQGNDVGTQYQTGIYWPTYDEQLGQDVRRLADLERVHVEASGLPFCVEVEPLSSFVDAEEYHQRFLVKNEGGYCHVPPQKIREVLGIFKSG